MLSKEQITSLMNIVDNEIKDRPYLRRGQSLFNNLVSNYPEYEHIRMTNLDPFYIGRRIPLLLEYLRTGKGLIKE